MSTTPNDGGPAFPFGQMSETTGQPINGYYNPGLSLRDYFAAVALQGLLANPKVVYSARGFASNSYLLADAMLAERAKRMEATS
jgi:hypothetical protein